MVACTKIPVWNIVKQAFEKIRWRQIGSDHVAVNKIGARILEKSNYGFIPAIGCGLGILFDTIVVMEFGVIDDPATFIRHIEYHALYVILIMDAAKPPVFPILHAYHNIGWQSS